MSALARVAAAVADRASREVRRTLPAPVDPEAVRPRAAGRALEWLTAGVSTLWTEDPSLRRSESIKSAGEVLLACAVSERNPRVSPRRLRALRERVLGYVCSDAFVSLVLRDPSLCRLCVPSLILAERCGAAQPRARACVQALVDTGYLEAVECTPFQDMEVAFFLELGGYRQGGPGPEALYSRTLAARMRSPLHLSEHDAYTVTHALFYLARFGEAPPDEVRAAAGPWIAEALELLLGRYIRERHWDLVGELLTCHALLGLQGSAVAEVGWRRLLQAQRDDGSVPGLSFDPASPRMAEPASAAEYRWECNAHPTLVAAMAFALA